MYKKFFHFKTSEKLNYIETLLHDPSVRRNDRWDIFVKKGYTLFQIDIKKRQDH